VRAADPEHLHDADLAAPRFQQPVDHAVLRADRRILIAAPAGAPATAKQVVGAAVAVEVDRPSLLRDRDA
jgi:hypothetical protein